MRASRPKAPPRRHAARAKRSDSGSSARGPAWLSGLQAFAAAWVTGRAGAASRALRAARRAGAKRVQAEETALMLMLHAGYPAAIEAMRALNLAWPGRARRSREGGPERWRAAGARLCRRVYGPNYPRLMANVRALHPDLATWMVEQGYGRVLSRPGLAARERELLAVSVLASLGWERQLLSHLIGAARLGAPCEAVRRAMRIGAARASARGRSAARRAWRAAFAKPDPGRPGFAKRFG